DDLGKRTTAAQHVSRRPAVADQAVGVIPDQRQLTPLQPAAGGHVRLPEGKRVGHDLEPVDLHARRRKPTSSLYESSSPTETRIENTASRRPACASARLSEGPSVRVATVRTRLGASAADSHMSCSAGLPLTIETIA